MSFLQLKNTLGPTSMKRQPAQAKTPPLLFLPFAATFVFVVDLLSLSLSLSLFVSFKDFERNIGNWI
ncbi:hypothetical protein V6N13_103637 [Hibiscus sabdariffa]